MAAVEAVKNGTVEPMPKNKKVAKLSKDDKTIISKSTKEKPGAAQSQKVKDVKSKSIVKKSESLERVDKPKAITRHGSKDSDSSKTKVKSVKSPEQKKGETKKSSDKKSPRVSTKEKRSVEPLVAEVTKAAIEDEIQGKPVNLQENGLDKIVNGNAMTESERIATEMNGSASEANGKDASLEKNISVEQNKEEEKGENMETKDKRKESAKPERPVAMTNGIDNHTVLEEKQDNDNEESTSKKDDLPKLENSATKKQTSPIAHQASDTSAPVAKDILNEPSKSVEKPVGGKQKSSKPSAEPIRKKSSFMKATPNVPNGDTNDSAPARPTTALRGPSIRPPSARPGAPRRRDRNVEIILQTEKAMQDAAEKNPPINNFVADLADDGENLVVIDNTNLQGDIMPRETENQIDLQNEREQGHLVQQILETQTVFSKAGNDGASGVVGKKEAVSLFC